MPSNIWLIKRGKMKNKIKLIFGENGAGKSLYYQQKSSNTDYIALNYDIGNWYQEIKDKNNNTISHVISQEMYLNLKKREKIEKFVI